MSKRNFYRILRELCFLFGFSSILLSLLFWFNSGVDIFQSLHQEHLAIFVGLWSPTFFILSKIFDKMVDDSKD
jgi:hypothetical protein